MTLIIGIPAYNEAKHIGHIVEKAKKYGQVVVVDDGSLDKTGLIAKEHDAMVIRHMDNQGVGTATRTLLRFALEYGTKDGDIDTLVTLDGDGQHNPEDIPKLLAQEGDIVIGSRFLGLKSNIPVYRRFGLWFINWLFNVGKKNKISDCQSCFRVYRTRTFIIPIIESGFGFSVENLVKAQRMGFKIAEVPVVMRYGRDGSTANPFVHGLSICVAIVKWRWLQFNLPPL